MAGFATLLGGGLAGLAGANAQGGATAAQKSFTTAMFARSVSAETVLPDGNAFCANASGDSPNAASALMPAAPINQ